MTRRGPALLLSGLVLVATAAPLLVPAQAAEIQRKLDNLPTSMHGSVDTQSMIVGAGGFTLFFTPGPSYAYATFDYDRFDKGSPPDVKMVARGVMLNPGDTAGAVMWQPRSIQPPLCGIDPQKPQQPKDTTAFLLCLAQPTGATEEAAGFPGYAEAFYPPFAGLPDRQHTHKCILNKDANGATPTGGSFGPACDAVPVGAAPGLANADTSIEDLSAVGFTRLAGASLTNLAFGVSEAKSFIQPDNDGNLVTEGYSAIRNVNLFNGLVTIESVKNSARIVNKPGARDALEARAACTFDGLQIMGQGVPVDPKNGKPLTDGMKPLLDGARQAGYDIQFVYPGGAFTGTDKTGNKRIASCEGLKIIITEIRAGSPTSARAEVDLGYIRVQSSVNNASLDFGNTSASSSSDLSNPSVLGVTTSNVTESSPEPVTTDTFAGAVPTETPSTEAVTATASGPAATGQAAAFPTKLVKIGPRTAAVVGWTLASTLAFGLAIWLLIGVVGALASGGPLRLPGTRVFR